MLTEEKNKDIRSYKYFGDYICLVHGFFLMNNCHLLVLEYGWQRIISKHCYTNIGFGIAKWITVNKSFALRIT
jgi:hypothetical protein